MWRRVSKYWFRYVSILLSTIILLLIPRGNRTMTITCTFNRRSAEMCTQKATEGEGGRGKEGEGRGKWSRILFYSYFLSLSLLCFSWCTQGAFTRCELVNLLGKGQGGRDGGISQLVPPHRPHVFYASDIRRCRCTRFLRYCDSCSSSVPLKE